MKMLQACNHKTFAYNTFFWTSYAFSCILETVKNLPEF